MTNRRRLLTSAVLLVAWLACDRPTPISFGRPAIYGVVTYSGTSGSQPARTEAEVEVQGTRLVPVVTVNKETLTLGSYSGQGEYFWNSQWYRADLGFAPGQECQLHVYQSNGDAQSDKLPLPGAMMLTAPADSSRLVQGNPLTIAWNPVTGIDRYEVEVYLQYEYIDTSGYWHYFYLDTTFAVKSNVSSVNIPASEIFPAQVDTVMYGYGSVDLSAEAGPDIGRESKGNISGNGVGYFWTRGSDRSIIFFGDPASRDLPDHLRLRSAQAVLRQKLRWLAQQDSQESGIEP